MRLGRLICVVLLLVAGIAAGKHAVDSVEGMARQRANVLLAQEGQ